tara:strand:- start:7631 stop:8653 length:1023 start_codon:yes stop_codon:yes gene_type:complete
MVEVIRPATGEITPYDNLEDARAEIAATLYDNDPNRIRFIRIDKGPYEGKYVYKILVKTIVLHGFRNLSLYTEKNTVRSLIDAYLEKFDLYDEFIQLREVNSGTVINIGALDPITTISIDITYFFQLRSSYYWWYTVDRSNLKLYYENVVRKLDTKDNLSSALRKEVNRIKSLLNFLEATTFQEEAVKEAAEESYVSWEHIERMDERIKTLKKDRSPRQTKRYSEEDTLLNISRTTTLKKIIKSEISNIVEGFVDAAKRFNESYTKEEIISKNRKQIIQHIVGELASFGILKLDDFIDTIHRVLPKINEDDETIEKILEEILELPQSMPGESKDHIQLRF